MYLCVIRQKVHTSLCYICIFCIFASTLIFFINGKKRYTLLKGVEE